MLVHRQVTSSIKFAGTHLYTRVERGTVSQNKVSCPRTRNTMSPGLELGPLDLVASWLVCLSPSLPSLWIALNLIFHVCLFVYKCLTFISSFFVTGFLWVMNSANLNLAFFKSSLYKNSSWTLQQKTSSATRSWNYAIQLYIVSGQSIRVPTLPDCPRVRLRYIYLFCVGALE